MADENNYNEALAFVFMSKLSITQKTQEHHKIKSAVIYFYNRDHSNIFLYIVSEIFIIVRYVATVVSHRYNITV